MKILHFQDMIFISALFFLTINSKVIIVDDFRKCPSLRPRVDKAKNVRDLRPDDIEVFKIRFTLKVIMAMGDSLTSGLNSRIPHSKFDQMLPRSKASNEFRGGSLITGGDPDSTSVGKILSHYSPSLSGLSRGNSTFLYCYGPICPAGTILPYEPDVMGLNAAQSGSWTTIYNTFNQLNYLDKYYKSFIPKSMNNPWKLLVLEFGFNNICSGCLKLTRFLEFSVEHFSYQIRSLIEEIRIRYSKIFITVVGPFNLSRVMPDD